MRLLRRTHGSDEVTLCPIRLCFPDPELFPLHMLPPEGQVCRNQFRVILPWTERRWNIERLCTLRDRRDEDMEFERLGSHGFRVRTSEMFHFVLGILDRPDQPLEGGDVTVRTDPVEEGMIGIGSSGVILPTEADDALERSRDRCDTDPGSDDHRCTVPGHVLRRCRMGTIHTEKRFS